MGNVLYDDHNLKNPHNLKNDENFARPKKQ